MDKKIHVGIDYSISCPCLAILNPDNPIPEKTKFFYTTSTKKYVGLFGDKGHIEGRYIDKKLKDMEKFIAIGNEFIDIINSIPVPKENIHVHLEGYSFGAGTKGMTFNIGEHTGVLKYLLHTNGYKYDSTAPTVVKKHLTGKGNAKKEDMLYHFVEKYGYDINKVLQTGYSKKNVEVVIDKKKGITETRRMYYKVSSPCADIVDSFAIARNGIDMGE